MLHFEVEPRRPTRGDAFEFYIKEVIIPVAVQSRRLIPHLMLPPTDPAGAKPRRDHRFLDRVSRHEVPKTPDKKSPVKIYDPARVSHLSESQANSATPYGSRDRTQ